MTHTLVALVRDRPAALNRAVSLFRRRGFNIEKLVVGPTEQPGVSRMTVDIDADNIDQVVEQLRRLIDVLTVQKVVSDSAGDWSASPGWDACSMPVRPHWQADGADDHVED